MVLSCFPPTVKCEWSDLRSFVDQYNATNGTSYTRKACLDVEIRDRKAPELLLESPGEIPIVIERKSIVWPSDYMASHRNEHQLFQESPRSLANAFEDGAYRLTVRADCLKGKSRTDVRKLVAQIAHEVLSDMTGAKMRRGIRGSGSIPWSFRPLRSDELDGPEPTPMIHVSVVEPLKLDSPLGSVEEIKEAKAGFAEEFDRALANAAAKFEEYPACLKILLAQFHGDDSHILDEEIAQIVESAQLPEMLDQVWLAQDEWVSDDELTVVWYRVR